MNDKLKQIVNPASTGGLGIHFENRIQASFVVLMLANGFSPCLPLYPIQKIELQAKHRNYETDDLVVYVGKSNTEIKAKLLGQVKHFVRINNSDSNFKKMIMAAWADFTNTKVFCKETDKIALICGPLSKTDTVDVRFLLEQARNTPNFDVFIERIEQTNFTSNAQRNKLEVFKSALKEANGYIELTREQLWLFLRSFYLLIYDLDIQGSVMLSLCKTIIEQQNSCDAD